MYVNVIYDVSILKIRRESKEVIVIKRFDIIYNVVPETLNMSGD